MALLTPVMRFESPISALEAQKPTLDAAKAAFEVGVTMLLTPVMRFETLLDVPISALEAQKPTLEPDADVLDAKNAAFEVAVTDVPPTALDAQRPTTDVLDAKNAAFEVPLATPCRLESAAAVGALEVDGLLVLLTSRLQ
jgi:hypothetical protein